MKALVELLKTLTRRRKEFRPKREGWTDPPLREMLTFKKRKRTKQEQHDFVVNWINRIRLENDAGARKN